MFWFDLFIAICVGLILTSIFSRIFRRTGPWDNEFLFFLITFLGTWAIGLWIKPIGPAFYGYYWIGYLAVGILIALIIASAGPPNTFKGKDLTNVKLKDKFLEEERRRVIIHKDIFLLAVILIFLITIMAGYIVE